MHTLQSLTLPFNPIKVKRARSIAAKPITTKSVRERVVNVPSKEERRRSEIRGVRFSGTVGGISTSLENAGKLDIFVLLLLSLVLVDVEGRGADLNGGESMLRTHGSSFSILRSWWGWWARLSPIVQRKR